MNVIINVLKYYVIIVGKIKSKVNNRTLRNWKCDLTYSQVMKGLEKETKTMKFSGNWTSIQTFISSSKLFFKKSP